MRAFLFLALAALLSLPAHADLTWTLNGVTFNDGGTAAGTIVYSDLGTETWSIAVSGGDTTNFAPFTYDGTDSTIGGGDGSIGLTILGPLGTVPLPGEVALVNRLLLLQLSTPSPTAGPANIALITGIDHSKECFNCNPERFVTAGSVDVSGTIASFDPFISRGAPEPSSWPLLAIGILVLFLHQRKWRVGLPSRR